MYSKIKSSFDISRRECRGMIVVFIVFFLIYCFPYVYEKIIWKPLDFKVEILQPYIEDINKFSYKTETRDENEETLSLLSEHALFEFNPNGLSVENWVKLGLSEKQAAIIKKYEMKGGKFYKKEDLRKIYSISEKQYSRLEPYINIPVKQADVSDKKYLKKEEISTVLIDINTADSFSMRLIKGIGPAFASRIVKYRDKLGGFVNKEQLKEVYGVDSVKLQQISPQIKIDTHNISFININTITFEDFKKFPYLTYRQKNVLLAYRNHHGNYKTLSELQKAAMLAPEITEKIAPYIKFND